MPSMQEDRTCYVGNLSKETDDRTIEDAFAKYGRVRSVWVARKPHGFAFVEFDDAHDAADAAKGLNGGKIAGDFVRVELKGRGSRGPPQRSEHRIVIRNLPRQCSWQDLKSTFRQICEPGFVELIGNGEAVAEFPTKEDMREIIKRFDNDEFFGNLITIIEDDGTHRPPSPQPARRRDSDRGYDRGGRDNYRGGGGGGGRGYDDRYGGGDYDRRDYRRESRRSRSRDRDRSRSRGRY